MKVTKPTICYLTSSTICQIEPSDNNTVYLKMVSNSVGKKIDSRISIQIFPKAVLEYQVKTMCKKIGVPYCPECLVGRWDYKSAIQDGTLKRMLTLSTPTSKELAKDNK